MLSRQNILLTGLFFSLLGSSSYGQKPADLMRRAVYANVDDWGLLQNASIVPTFTAPGTSPEGQAFFLKIDGGYRKYIQ